MKLVSAGEQSIIRNLDLIDISREPFDIFQLQSLATELEKIMYPNFNMIRKLFGVLEFNENNATSMITRLTTMAEYPLHTIINKDYIKQVMMGEI